MSSRDVPSVSASLFKQVESRMTDAERSSSRLSAPVGDFTIFQVSSGSMSVLMTFMMYLRIEMCCGHFAISPFRSMFVLMHFMIYYESKCVVDIFQFRSMVVCRETIPQSFWLVQNT